MGLKVWLPLNGSLKNNGTSKYVISKFRGSVVYNDSGKLGKCFYANGVNTLKILNIIPDFYNYTAYSLCAWCYVEAQNTVHSGSAIISGGNWNQQVINMALSNWSTDHYTNLRISGTNWNVTYSYNFSLNTWYHIVVCCDGVKTYAYVNGSQIGNTAASFLPTSIEGNDICIGGATYYDGMQFFGKINDVRIYDHCLSATEVRELSKGLVAHYKLDDIASGRVKDSSGYSYNATIVGTPTTVTGSPRYSCAAGFNGTDATINCGRAYYIQQAPALSFSAWVKADNWSSSTLRYYVSCQEAGGFLLQSQADNTVRARVHAYTASDLSTQAYVDATYAQTVAGWHMLTGVYTTSSMKLYIDGILKTTTTTTTYGAHFYTSANTYIAAESAGTSPSNLTACSVSDVRIYYTALSDADVKDLYQTGMKADTTGRLHAYEFSEGGKEAFYKTGDVSAHAFSESNSGLKIKNQEIDANQFIEY